MIPAKHSLIAKIKAADIYLQIACFLFMVITFLPESMSLVTALR
jgi:hypothetical protein